MRPRRIGTFSTYVNTVSNRTRLKSVFTTTMTSVMTSGLMTFIFWMVAQIAADVCDLFSRIKEIGSLAFSRVGSSNPKRREKDEEAIWEIA
jgi:hypothetical protein